jgi:hypothetical protein
MKRMQRIAAMVVGSLVMASSAWALPTWIGVYGAFERHTTNSNPGTYTILMNQDYFGLNAEVGVQVNGGAWATFPMSLRGQREREFEMDLHPGGGVSGRRECEVLFPRLAGRRGRYLRQPEWRELFVQHSQRELHHRPELERGGPGAHPVRRVRR